MRESVSIILVTDNRKIILQHRDNKISIEYPNYWGLIGGWVEQNEAPVDAIKREIFEELYSVKRNLLEIKDLKLLFSEFREDKGWTEYVFFGIILEKIEILRISEGQGISEFAMDNSIFLLKVAPHHKAYIKKYFVNSNHKLMDMKKIEKYLELIQLGNVKDYKALEIGNGYILSKSCNSVGVFHTQEDAKVIALLVFEKDVPRGFHYHNEKVEYLTVLSGKLKCNFSLLDSDENLEIVLSEGQQIRILPGCIHTYTALENNVYAIEYAPQRYKESDVITVK